MAEPHSLNQSLNAMLNMVLIQTGKIFRDPDMRNPSHINLARSRLLEFVPVANHKFQTTLDEVEVEILQAKAVLERDLSKIRKRRAARERKPSQPGIVGGGGEPPSDEIATVHAEDDKTKAQEGQIMEDQDTVMVDALTTDMPANEGDQKPIDDATTSQQVESVGNIPQDAQVTTGVAMPMPDDTKPAAAESRTAPNNQDPSSNIEQDPFDQLDVPIDLGNTADLFDLDSMFNDAEIIPSGGVESDLDIDFSLGGSADLTNALGDSTMGGINLSTSDNNAGTNEDLNSLLPGLENFVNAPGENNTAVPNTLGNNNTKTAAADQQQTSTAAAPENDGGQPAPDDSFVGTNFDDLFNPSDFNMGNEGNDSNEFNLDQDFGEIGNFDDVWLDNP